ncbi:NAD-dependent epimerase/dehydratase family protein [Neorhizobium sp. LjRoot104]|uniref:NAD-dependent epimerase/dehydratase family protein n=1 Tax=Neorhizobium sp. LjRoot104 TaxID=3342254 RepID=UPI003ECE2409
MKAAIIGPRSMLGRGLSKQLKSAGITVITIGRHSDDDIRFDLTEGAPDTRGLTADVVYHCACAFGDDSEQGVVLNMASNGDSAQAVTTLTTSLGASTLIYAGSVLSDPSVTPDGQSSYGMTKGIAELYFTWAMTKRMFRFCSVRLAQLYDTEGMCKAHQPWIGVIVTNAASGVDTTMPPADGAPRNYLHVQEAAAAMIAANDLELTGIVNFTNPQSVTVSDIANAAYEAFGKGGRVIIDPAKGSFRPMYFPETSASLPDPKITMDDGMRMIREAGTAPGFARG